MACCLEGTSDSERKRRELEGPYPQGEQNGPLELVVDKKQQIKWEGLATEDKARITWTHFHAR